MRQEPHTAQLPEFNTAQLAAGVAPWVPVAANQRDGQVAALYAGLARTGQAGPAAVATSRGETRRTEVSLKE